MQVLVFTINGNYYGLDTNYIDEVIIRQKLTPMLNVSDCIAGMTYVRESCYVCVDLSNTLFKERSKWAKTQKFLLTSYNNRMISYIVDDVSGVFDIALKDVHTEKIIGGDDSLVDGYIVGDNTIITLLNLSGINQASSCF